MVPEMRTLALGNTDFGIDTGKSAFAKTRKGDTSILDVEIHGDAYRYEELQRAENNDGLYDSWDAPHFYLRGYRLHSLPIVSDDGIATYHSKLAPPDYDSIAKSYEIAIYWEIHHGVQNVAIQFSDDLKILVTGLVDLMGTVMPFRVEWDKSANPIRSQT
jgi:hypothetical protein